MNTGRRERSGGLLLLLCFLLSLGTLLGTATISQAQERTGTITGELKDASGGVLPGATVVITNKATGRVITLVTDGGGTYRVDVDPGNYSVRYEMSGFARQEQPDVEVHLGATATINATMKVGNMSEAVQVTAESAPQIDARGTMISHTVSAEEFNRLPKGRSFQSIAMMAPSVNQGELEGGYQVNGASGAENVYTVDGIMTNSVINGSSRQNTVFEYLQEVQVKTTGISAEYGGALGGVISAVTRSGGNAVHGEAHYYYEGSALSASPVKRLVLSPTDNKTVSYVQDSKAPDNRNEPGASIGGPIVKDHLWYFGSYSPRFNRTNKSYNYSSGTDLGSIKRTQTLSQTFGKLSYGSGHINSYGTVLWTPTTSKGTLPALNGTGPDFISSTRASNAAKLTQGFEQNQVNTTGNVDIILSSNAVLTGHGGYFYDNYNDTGIPLVTSWSYQSVCCNQSTPPANFIGPVGTQNTPRIQLNEFDRTKRGLFNLDYSQNFHAAGFHNLKAGYGFQHTVNDVRKAYPGGYEYIWWDQTLVNPNGSGGKGKYGYYEVDEVGTIGTAGANLNSIYIQDQWQVNDRLTVNFGARTEDEKLPTFRPDILKYAFHFTMAQKLAPRLGAAYDLHGDGKIKLFGSWGRYFDYTKYELARGSFGGDTWKTWYRAIDDSNLNSFQSAHVENGQCVGCTGTDLWQVPGSFRDQRVPDFSGLDPNIKPMSQDSTNGGIDMQLSASTALGIHYVHNHLNRTIEDIGALVDGNETYIYGNPGEGLATVTPTTGLTAPFATPTAKRNYDALQVSVDRRFSNRWFASANYTLSRLWGNYAGLQSSDEIRTPTLGVGYTFDQNQAASIFRPGGNETRAWDLDEYLWDSHGHLDVTGLLPTDRTHVVKLFGSYQAPFGTTLGLFQYAGSGTPLSTYVNTSNNIPVFVNGRGDLGRTPFLTRTDLLVSHELKMLGSRSLRAELNITNLFNQKSTRHLWNSLNRGYAIRQASSSINLSKVDLAKGYDYNALIAASPDAQTSLGALDPRWLKPDLFSDGLSGYFTLKFVF